MGLRSLQLAGAAAFSLWGCSTGPVSRPGYPAITAITQASAGAVGATQRNVELLDADLAFDVFPKRKQIAGVAQLSFEARLPTSEVILDLDRNLVASQVAFGDVVLPKSGFSNPGGKLRIALPHSVSPGEMFRLTISYSGTPHVAVNAPWDGGIVWSKTAGGQPWVATAHQLQGCDLLWPCIDHPQAEPRSVDIRITVPPGLSAPANGILQGIQTRADGRRTFHWRVKNPNTYAINLNVGPYEVMRGSYRSRFGNSIPLEFWHLPGNPERVRKLFDEFAPTLDFFEAMIGPFPFGDEKVGVVETPHKGMEHQTMNAYGANFARDAYGFDTLFQHEFAHEWFANQLTNKDADDFWLHEGFGSYMQPLYAEWRGGQMPYMARMFQLRAGVRNCYPIVSGRSRTVEQVYKPKTGPGGDVYGKAAWMLHTLRGLIGDKAFFEATRRIVYGRPDPRPGNFKPRFGSTTEFIGIVNDLAQADLSWFFGAYLHQAALPKLISQRHGSSLTLEWSVPGGGAFPLPVEVRHGSKVERLPMTGGKGVLTVSPGEQVVLDPAGKLLRQSDDIDALHTWQYEEALRKLKPGDDRPPVPCLGK